MTYLRFCFRAKAIRHEPERTLDKEIIRAVWMTPDELRAEQARHRSPLVLRCVEDAMRGQDTPLSLIRDLRFPTAG